MARQDQDVDWDEDGPTVRVGAAEIRRLLGREEASALVPFTADDGTVEEEGPSSFSLDMPSIAQLDAVASPRADRNDGQGFAVAAILAAGALIGGLILFLLTL